MKGNILSTLGVFTTFCQPVSSCVYGTSLLPRAEGSLEGSWFGHSDPIEPLPWPQLIPDADHSELVNVEATLKVLAYVAIGATRKSNDLRQFDVDISTKHRVIRGYLPIGSHGDLDAAAVAFLTHLDETYSTQVFDATMSPATATAEPLSLISPLARANNNPVMSEGVVGTTAPAPIVIVDEFANAVSELMWFDRDPIYRRSSGSLTSYSRRLRPS